MHAVNEMCLKVVALKNYGTNILCFRLWELCVRTNSMVFFVIKTFTRLSPVTNNLCTSQFATPLILRFAVLECKLTYQSLSWIHLLSCTQQYTMFLMLFSTLPKPGQKQVKSGARCWSEDAQIVFIGNYSCFINEIQEFMINRNGICIISLYFRLTKYHLFC